MSSPDQPPHPAITGNGQDLQDEQDEAALRPGKAGAIGEINGLKV